MKHILITTICCLTFAFQNDVHAQWELVAPNLINVNLDQYWGIIYANEGDIWAGEDALWMSADTGRTWAKRNPPLSSYEAIISIHFFNKNTGVVGTSADGSNRYGRVYLTSDRGLTWKLIKRNTGASTHITGVCFVGSVNDIIAVNCEGGTISYTHDGGVSWTDVPMKVSSYAIPAYTLGVYPLPSGNVYALSGVTYPMSMHLEVSTDKGETWTEMPGKIDPDCHSFIVDACDENTIIAANESWAYSFDLEANIYRSTDRGVSWKSSAQFTKAALTGAIIASNDAYFIQSTEQVLRSTDKGGTWKEIGGPGNSWDSKYICAMDNNILFAVDMTGSIYRTRNGGGDSLASSGIGKQYALTLPIGVVERRHDTAAIIPIYLKRSEAVPALEFSIIYNNADYEYIGTFDRSGNSVDVASASSPGKAKVLFPSSALVPDGDSLIGYTHIKIRAVEPFCSEIIFDSARFDNNLVPCGRQYAITGTTIKVGNYYGCGGVVNEVADGTIGLQSISVYPNPAKNSVVIEGLSDISDARVEMIDQLGKTVMTSSGSHVPSSTRSLDVSSLVNGVYYLRIEHNGSVKTTKVVILR